MSDEKPPPVDRLGQLEELVTTLRPVILANHSEHGLQGLSGLVGQYRAAIKELEELRASSVESKGTPLDELANRRADRGADAARKTRSAR